MEKTELLKAVEYSEKLISVRPRSVKELRSRLQGRGYESELIEAAVAMLEEMSLLDDMDFSVWWIESCYRVRPRGIYAIKQELAAKGVNQEIIENALASTNMDIDKEVDMARMIIDKLILKNISLSKEKLKLRAIAKLKSKAFSWDSIETILMENNLSPS